MRYIYILLSLSLSVFSQSPEELSNIRKNSNAIVVDKLESEFNDYARAQKIEIDNFYKSSKFVEFGQNKVQKIIFGTPIFYRNFNEGASRTINTNSFYPSGNLGINITGSGILAGVWDSGKVRRTHVELVNKITFGDATFNDSDHATHVTGTMIASGVDAKAKGIAYNAQVKSYNWSDDYNEMLKFGKDGYLVSNHSYGYSADNLPEWIFGSYDDSSYEIDAVSSAFPYYQIVVAAGNDRDSSSILQVSDKSGYDLLSGMCDSKNALVVAAVGQVDIYNDKDSVVMSSFSNYGPTDDGRIKPDISAKGYGVYSCSSTSNTSYLTMNGTSMAAPGISGLIILLQNYYNSLNSGQYLKASQVRGLICHTAREAGYNIGPDYEFGWGLANGEDAAKVIGGRGLTSVLEANSLTSNSVFSQSITLNSQKSLKVSIAWTDPVGTLTPNGVADSRSPKLINNLDLKVKRNGVTYYPWKLDVENPTDAATRISENEVDNIEVVQIDLADPGVYTIEVSHKGTLQGGSQEFALIATGFDSLLNNDSFDFNNNVVIYPNPASNVLNFSTPSGEILSNVVIFDALGKEIKISKSVLNNTLDISELSSGLYIAKFFHNGKLMVNKFIKE